MGWGKARFFLIIGLLALALSGAQNAFLDASENRVFLVTSVLSDYPADVIAHDPNGSWAFKGRSAQNGPAWPGADSFAAAPTDFWHWSRFWQLTFLSLGAIWLFWSGYYWPVNMRGFGRFSLGIVLLVFGYLAYFGGHWAMWNHVLPREGVELAQIFAKGWVDGFVRLHAEMQTRGILG